MTKTLLNLVVSRRLMKKMKGISPKFLLTCFLILMSVIRGPIKPALADQATDSLMNARCARLMLTNPFHLKTVKEIQFFVQTRSAIHENELPDDARQAQVEKIISGFLQKEFRSCFIEEGFSLPPVHSVEQNSKSVSAPGTLTMRALLEVDQKKHFIFMASFYRPSEVDPFWDPGLQAIVIDSPGDIKKSIDGYLWDKFVRHWEMVRFDDKF